MGRSHIWPKNSILQQNNFGGNFGLNIRLNFVKCEQVFKTYTFGAIFLCDIFETSYHNVAQHYKRHLNSPLYGSFCKLYKSERLDLEFDKMFCALFCKSIATLSVCSDSPQIHWWDA